MFYLVKGLVLHSYRLSPVCLKVYCVSANSIENATEMYDYDEGLGNMCSESYAKTFGRVFIPTLYSLVFIVGFAGASFVNVCVCGFFCFVSAFATKTCTFPADKTPNIT